MHEPLIHRFLTFAIVLGVSLACPGWAVAVDRPNILLVTCEDMGPDLGCYGDDVARTPRLDAFAERSTRFTAAFATAPVCSPARTALFYSRYQHAIGGSNHRSRPMAPEELSGFASELRTAGYYCTNHAKFDVNVRRPEFVEASAFEEGRGWWDERRQGRPFFAIINIEATHQSRTSVWPVDRFKTQIRDRLDPSERHTPSEGTVPPYYPDTPDVRLELARYRDCVTFMDRRFGSIIDRLEADGLSDSTVVIFMSDHGAGHAAHKRTALSRGTRVPLILHVPNRWAHHRPSQPGRTDDNPVSFVDIGPTILEIAGVEPSPQYHGVSFLDQDNRREFAFVSRDRIDEDIDHSRMVTDGRYVYVRHYYPSLPLWTRNGYAFPSAIYQAVDGLRPPAPDAALRLVYAERGSEAFYDLTADPYEILNLVDEMSQQSRLATFRDALEAHQQAVGDMGLVPEGILATEPEPPLVSVLRVANLIGHQKGALEDQIEATSHASAAVRYWAVVGLGEQLVSTQRASEVLIRALRDPSATVRAAAVRACTMHRLEPDAVRVALFEAMRADVYFDTVYAARTGQVLGWSDDAFFAVLSEVAERWDRYEFNEMTRSVKRVRESNERPLAGPLR